MGEIGNLKNRFKVWRQNLRRKKKLEEQELESKQKKKQYNRFQVVTRTIFGLFLALLETTIFSSKKKQQAITPKKITVELQLIDKQITHVEQTQVEMKKNISQVKTLEEFIPMKQEQEQMHQEIVNLKTKQQMLKRQVALLDDTPKKKAVEKPIPEVEKILSILTTQEDKIIKLEQEEHVIDALVLDQKANIEKKVMMQEVPTNAKHVGISNIEREELLNYLKENNQLIKEIDSLLKKLSEPISDNEIEMTLMAISNLYDKLFPCYLSESSIRHQIRFSKYQNDMELKKIDKAGFLVSDGIYKERMDFCLHKKQELQDRHLSNQKKKEEEKEQTYKLKQKKTKVNNLDHEKKELKNTILEQRIMIGSLESSLEKLTGPKKKKGILSRMGALIKNTLFVGLGLTGIFSKKRSMVSVLTGVLLTNHGIRGMRNMNRTKEDKINYFDVEKILNQIKSEKSALIMSLDFCDDSFSQLSLLQEEVMREYPYSDDMEVVALKEQLLELEDQLMEQRQNLLKAQEEMEVVYQQGLQKIKKLEEK